MNDLNESFKGLNSPAKAKALQSPDKERPAQKRNSQGTPSGVHRLPRVPRTSLSKTAGNTDSLRIEDPPGRYKWTRSWCSPTPRL